MEKNKIKVVQLKNILYLCSCKYIIYENRKNV